MGNCPEWLLQYLPPAFEAELAALNTDAPTDLRVNTLVAKREAIKLDADFTPKSPYGLRLKKRQPLDMNGQYEVQDEGSQLVTIYAAPQPGEKVLDYCAGAGGKTLMMAALMQNKGEITAFDIDPRRLETLKKRAKQAKVEILNFENMGGYDLVFVDAPCSGTGTWRRAPDAKWRLTASKLKYYIFLQRQVLADASRFVKKGGRLVYVTCSVLPIENEQQVEWFLRQNKDFKQSGEAMSLSPFKTNTDGFFAVSFERL